MNAASAPPMALTANEASLIRAYRVTDDRGRIVALGTAERQAAMYPRRTAPTLRLVDAGTSAPK